MNRGGALQVKEDMDLTPILAVPNSFTLLMAPPAWGKTRLLLRQMDGGDDIWIFLSPLRALADEFYRSCEGISARYLIEKGEDWGGVRRAKGMAPTVVVTTPECLRAEKLESIAKGRRICVVMDEFHLFYLWGHSFRPQLWDSLLALSCRGFSFLGLSATMNQVIRREWWRDFPLAFDVMVEIDLGNGRFKHLPQMIHYFSPWGGRMLERRFLSMLPLRRDATVLYFCRYRRQVDAWVAFCRRQGVLALGCKGGEVERFIQEMDSLSKPPAVIFTTTALSHGVNLPRIDKVFLSYVVESRDFWLQMATRGGRRGGPFQIYTLNSYKNSLLKCLFSLLLNCLWDIPVRLLIMLRML